MTTVRHIAILVLSVFCMAPSAPPIAEYYFGFSLMTSANSQLGSFYVVKTFDNTVVGNSQISKEQFVLQAKGLLTSKANISEIDYFSVNEIGSCIAEFDDYGNNYNIDCSVLDNIWRLRFNEYPILGKVQPVDHQGWSTKPHNPSTRQWQILDEYGSAQGGVPFYGDDAWRLLRDMSNPKWVADYRGTGE